MKPLAFVRWLAALVGVLAATGIVWAGPAQASGGTLAYALALSDRQLTRFHVRLLRNYAFTLEPAARWMARMIRR